MLHTTASQPSPSIPSLSRHDGPLSAEECHALTGSGFMSRLPAPLVDAIMARVRVWRLGGGEVILCIGQPLTHWIGIAHGSAQVLMQAPHEAVLQCTNWAFPGVWFNFYQPLALQHSEVEVRVEGPTTVAVVEADDLAVLASRFPAFTQALAIASALNVRRALQAVAASQHATIRRRQLVWLIEMARVHTVERIDGQLLVRVGFSQDTLAQAYGVSRQAWCEGLKLLEQEGLVRRATKGLLIPDLAVLEAALSAEATAVEAPCGSRPLPNPSPASAEAGPSAAQGLRSSELASLRRGRWFASLSAPLQQSILERSVVRRLAAGEVLLRAGEWPPACWLVVHGAIMLDSSPDPAARSPVTLLPEGACYAHHDLIYEGASLFDAVAVVSSTLVELPAADFLAFFWEGLDLRLALMKLLAKQHSRITYHAAGLDWPIETRVGIWLQMMHHHLDTAGGSGQNIAGAFTMEEIAQWLGTTRQAVSRRFRQLEEQGVIRRGRGQLEVLKPEHLPRVPLTR